MMFFTADDAYREIKKLVNGGSCKRPDVYERVNTATRRLLARSRKPIHIRRLVRFFTRRDLVTLPAGVERILHYNMDGIPSPLFSSAYEFVSHGPGDIDCEKWFSSKFLQDMGNSFSTMFDVPSYTAPETCTDGPTYTELKLVAFSTAEADRGKTLRITGRGEKNQLLGGQNGILLPVSVWDGGVEGNFTYAEDGAVKLSTEGVRDVAWVHKPATDGFVCLYTFDPATHQLYFISKYHPGETQPRYRRYRITAPSYTYGSSILALCELGYTPITHDTDVLIIQNIDALKLMVMALEMEEERDFNLAKTYEADAYRLIDEQRTAERTHDDNIIQMSNCWGFGGISGRA